jgi:hypothetical protein
VIASKVKTTDSVACTRGSRHDVGCPVLPCRVTVHGGRNAENKRCDCCSGRGIISAVSRAQPSPTAAYASSSGYRTRTTGRLVTYRPVHGTNLHACVRPHARPHVPSDCTAAAHDHNTLLCAPVSERGTVTVTRALRAIHVTVWRTRRCTCAGGGRGHMCAAHANASNCDYALRAVAGSAHVNRVG